MSEHKYRPMPRGEHAITVRLCYDCDKWHAEDDSILYNEYAKAEWESVNRRLEAEVERLNAYKALASKLRDSIGYAYISERAVFEFISGYDAIKKEKTHG